MNVSEVIMEGLEDFPEVLGCRVEHSVHGYPHILIDLNKEEPCSEFRDLIRKRVKGILASVGYSYHRAYMEFVHPRSDLEDDLALLHDLTGAPA